MAKEIRTMETNNTVNLKAMGNTVNLKAMDNTVKTPMDKTIGVEND